MGQPNHSAQLQWYKQLLMALAVASIVMAGSLAGVFHLLEWAIADLGMRLRPPEAKDDRIVIVTINESDLQRFKQWPLSDRLMAQLLNRIQAEQPRAIGLDIYRDLPVEPGHRQLVQTFEQMPNLIGIEKIAGKSIAPPPRLAEKGQVAANDLILDADGKIRRALLVADKADGTQREGLGMALALKYMLHQGLEFEILDEEKQIYKLGKAQFTPLSSFEGQYWQADTQGYQMLINYRGEDPFPHISLTAVMDGQIPKGLMRDRLVLIGAEAPSLNDLWRTPYNLSFWNASQSMPGIRIHASIASQILSAALEGRPLLKATNLIFEGGWILTWSIVGVAIGVLWVQRWWARGALVLCCLLILLIAYIALIWGWIIPFFTPILAVTGAAIVSIVATLWDNLRFSYRELQAYAHTLEEKNQELLQLQTELKESNEQLEAVLDAVPGAIAWFNERGQYLGVNRHHAQLWDVTLNSHIGQSIDFLEGSRQLAQFIREFLPSSRYFDSKMIALEIQGEPRTYLVAAQKYKQGRAVVSVGIDITERVKAEEALRIAEENYRSIYENALEGIFQSSIEGKYIRVNPAMAKIYGYDSPETMMATISEISDQIYVDAKTRDYFQQIMQKEGKIEKFEYQSYRCDGSLIWIEESTRAVKDSAGNLLYYEGIVQDITTRKREEEEYKRQLEELQIEIDQAKRQQQVTEITDSGFFKEIQSDLETLLKDDDWG